MGRNRIKLTNVSKSYYSESAVTQALRRVNLSFSEGEFVVITGESGSGKSTLLNIIGGMDSFDDGELFIDGEPTFQYDDADWEDYRREKIGYVFQDYSLIGHYSALENVAAALQIMGCERQLALQKAKEYLAQVGLAGLEDQRAIHLSSGQKQRLSIARALAKETGIIVADEPTGNLDSETAASIVKLLSELAESRLVIMVTHNYDLVEDYATRKIRLHDGEIASDVSLKDEPENADEKAPEPENLRQKITSKLRRFNAMHLARLNRRSQLGRTILFTAFFLITAVVSFVFIAELFYYADDIHTKYYIQTAYYQENDTRLSVKKSDGSELTSEDLEEIAAISNVVAVDSCDLANDVNYYIESGVDYTVRYGVQRGWERTKEIFTYSFVNEEKFVRSTDCISESDLAAGRLPESLTEIVIYSEDESLLGTTKTVFFTSNNIWGSGKYCSYEMTIVGILSEETEQVYFATEFCQMIVAYVDADYLYEYVWVTEQQDYVADERYIMIIAEDLQGDLTRKGGNTVSNADTSDSTSSILLHFEGQNDRGLPDGNALELWAEVYNYLSNNTSTFLEVSSEFFYEHYTPTTTQATVYITSYAMTDSVIAKLEKKGFDVVSTYRVSAGEYNVKLVESRLIVMAICGVGLFMLALAQILILRSLMKLKIKDFIVLRFIGTDMSTIKLISYFEMLTNCIIAVVIAVAAMWALRLYGIEQLDEIMWYVQAPAYICYLAYNLLCCTAMVATFNRSVGRSTSK